MISLKRVRCFWLRPVRLGMQIANVKLRQIWSPRVGKIWVCTPQNRTYRVWVDFMHFSFSPHQIPQESFDMSVMLRCMLCERHRVLPLEYG